MKYDRQERQRYLLITLFLVIAVTLGFAEQGFADSISSFLTIQVMPARLIQDYSTFGVGGALLNASLVALMGLLLTRFSSVTLAGPTIAAVFTMFGFGLFGKSVLNIVWIILGVFIASRLAGKSFGSYSLIALFGTALGPLVTYVMFDLGLPYAISLPLGALSGIAAGFLLPALAGQMLSLHQGYSLYNMGFTCGFLGLFAASILKASKAMAPIEVFWNTAHSTALTLIIPIFSLLSILYGFLFSPYSFRRIIGEVIGIQNQTGRLPSDFFDIVENSESPWVNMGLLGFAGFAIVVATGSTINGPIIAGLATLMGFGLFGKSLKNSYPIIVGVIAAALLFGKPLTSPGVILAILFSTTLAPIAGQFGIIIGIISGFIHLTMVEATGIWHGGFDLYNNGFAGGLTATLVITIIHWYQTISIKEDFIDET